MRQVKVLPAYYAVPDQSITAFCNLLIGLSRWTDFRPACRTAEWLRQKQAGQAPSGNRGAARQILACQTRKLNEETRNQETESVKSYGGFCTFEPLGPFCAEATRLWSGNSTVWAGP